MTPVVLADKRVAWLVPPPIEGSGGFRTMFTNANYLEQHGYKCTLFVDNRYNGEIIESAYVMKKLIQKHFGKTDCQIKLGWELKGDFEIIFATYWETAKLVRDYPTKAKKAYFIQDFEAYFNPMGDGYILAENSYKYGLKPVSIGKWLVKVMQDNYNMPAASFDLCADTKIYNNRHLEREEKSVCMIYQPEKPRRCPIIGIETLGILKHLVPDAKIYLYGSNQSGHIWYDHTNMKMLTPEQCAELYNKCSVGLCLSSSNPSRIPFEMLACGLPVVEMYRENNLYDIPDSGALLADGRPESLALAIKHLFDNPDLRNRMSQAGTQYMQHKDIEKGYEQFLEFVEALMKGDKQSFTNVKKVYNRKSFFGDINAIVNYQNKEQEYILKRQRLKNVLRRIIPRRVINVTKESIHMVLFRYHESKNISKPIRRVVPPAIRKRVKSLLVNTYA